VGIHVDVHQAVPLSHGGPRQTPRLVVSAWFGAQFTKEGHLQKRKFQLMIVNGKNRSIVVVPCNMCLPLAREQRRAR
jgi:hypothetical protein